MGCESTNLTEHDLALIVNEVKLGSEKNNRDQSDFVIMDE